MSGSKKIGFKISSGSGLGEHKTRGVKASVSRPKGESFWLNQYSKRLSSAGGSMSVSGDSIKHTDPSGKTVRGSVSEAIDGRTVAGLNLSKARLEKAGYGSQEAVDIALDRLANYRTSPESGLDYQRSK